MGEVKLDHIRGAGIERALAIAQIELPKTNEALVKSLLPDRRQRLHECSSKLQVEDRSAPLCHH